VPAFFREAGFDTTTIAELFGTPRVEDVRWIRRAGELDMVVAHKDSRIRYRPAERRAVIETRLRMLCLVSGNMKAAEQVERFRSNLAEIERWWTRPGPWILAIRRDGIESLPLS
jgi:hypothetical protein